jgi:alanine racemase
MSELTFNRVVIDLAALKANYRLVRNLCPQNPPMAVVKGDAYGHGLVRCAKTLAEAGAKVLGVLDASEGETLRQAGIIEQDICVLAGLYTTEQILSAVKNRLTFVAYSLNQIRRVQNSTPPGSRLKAFIKIDTGMGRLGVPYWEANEVFRAISRVKFDIEFLGLMTHLATTGDNEAKRQLERFNDAIGFDRKFKLTRGRHGALASSGLLLHTDFPDQLSRVGLLLYGVNPLSERDIVYSREDTEVLKGLKPVMSLSSPIIQIRTIKAGETIGYDRTYVAQKDLKAATLPLGYVHGLARSRSNRGYALIHGQPAKLLGRVSMNLSLYDVTDIPKAVVGDRAVLLGESDLSWLKIEEVAKWQDTNPYEALCLFGRLNPRFYLD